jgi:hypothetical protein
MSNTEQSSSRSSDPLLCKTCGHQKYYVDCWNCGGEVYVDHDCGEDVCCCFYPEDNIMCDICRGKGGFHQCVKCHPECFDEH